MKYFLSGLLCAFFASAFAQNNVGIGTTTPNASAVLDVSSTTRGLLPPRMTAVQRNAISNPANGLMVYDTDSSALMIRSAGIWNKLSSTALGDLWRSNGGDAIYSGNAGNVGIGVSAPLFKLDLLGRMLIRGDGNVMNSPGVVFTNAAGTNYNGLVGTQTDSLIGLFGSSNNMPNNGWGLNMNVYNGRVGIGTNAAKAALHVADSAVLFSGLSYIPPFYSTTINPPAQGPGTRMMWFPPLGAFRVGYVDGVQWDKDSIGLFSFAAGYSTKAKGNSSVAMGALTTASGYNSTSLGYGTTASGAFSTSMGIGTIASEGSATSMGFATTASGEYATSMGRGTVASGDVTTSIGFETTASGDYSTSMGKSTLASGAFSTSMGESTRASGVGSLVSGGSSVASGDYAVSHGEQTIAKARGGFATGSFNDNSDNPESTTPAATDRIFQLGNGNTTVRSNALTILRNGFTGIGINDPIWHLDIAGRMRIRNAGDGTSSAGLWLNKNSNSGSNVFIGNRDDSTVGFYGNDGANWGLMMNTKNGRVGIGFPTPNAPLQFSNEAQNRKIVLYESANNDHQFYGFGINGSALRYQTSGSVDDHVFFSGINSTSSRELMRIKGNGNVGIGTVSPNSFGHGGNNRILDITNNTSSGANVQSHVVLSGTGTSGGMGGITWANYQLLGELRTGYIGNEFEANSSIPNTALTFSTRSTGLFERMRISSAGNVGIGTTNPARPLSFPATLEKKISLYPGGTGDAGFGVFGNELRINSDNAGADITMGFDNYTNGFTERMRVKGNGNTGIGVSDPAYLLDISNRMRIRGKPGFTAGIWLNNEANTGIPAFIGMQADNQVGLYGSGTGWSFLMNTQTGAVSFGGNAGQPGQVLTSNGTGGAPSWQDARGSKLFYYAQPPPPSIAEFSDNEVDIPGAIANFTIVSAARVKFNYSSDVFARSCFACGDKRVLLRLRQNISGGTTLINQVASVIPNAQTMTVVSGPVVLDLAPGTYSYKLTILGNGIGSTISAGGVSSLLSWEIYPN